MYKKEKVTDYEEYSIDTEGVAYSKRDRPLKYSINHDGYKIVNFYVNHKRKGFAIHTLVARQFIPNDDLDKTHVNHKNGNKLDNRMENLEWTTPKENTDYSILYLGYIPGKSSRKPVAGYCGETETYRFDSLSDAARFISNKYYLSYKNSKNNIYRAIHGKRKTYKGLTWKYI